MAAKRKPTYAELEAENERLTARIEELLKRIEELERARKRQAAPFGKDPAEKPEKPKKPKKRGRRSGRGKWQRAEKPERVDETLEATLPPKSPCCGAAVSESRVADQYQTELPPIRPLVRHFRVHVGACSCCGKRIQGRHRLQTSDALGAASVQLGPRVLALGAVLNKTYGMSWERVASFIERIFGIKAASSTYCRAAVERLARRAAPLYESLMDEVAASPIVTADETGWRIDGKSAWLWVLTTPESTVYTIDPSRSWAVPAEILGPDWTGTLVRDGYATYRQFKSATHQTCLAHLLRRTKNLLKTAKAGEARFPHLVKRVLKATLALRDRRSNLTPHGFASLRGRLRAQVERMLAWTPTYAPNAASRSTS